MRICVCVCTFRRPRMLRGLLERLVTQRTEGEFAVSIVVTDNDREQSAREVVAEMASFAPQVPILYCTEPEQNIAKARNTALRHSTGDFLAFIDDDEVPGDDWLLTAFRACLRLQADGVLGPVRPLFEQAPPSWLLKGRFCERPEHPTGHRLSWRECRTGNVLLRREWIEKQNPPFSPQYGNGGEDSDFFRRLDHLGARFMWCREAAVLEHVPPQRCRRAYFLRRALLRGQNETGFSDVASLGKSVLAVLLYALLLPLALLGGQHRLMHVLIRLCDHAGKIAALFGIRPAGRQYLTGP